MGILQRFIFDLWYLLGSPPWDTGVSPPELMEVIQSRPSGRALDLGCGTGTNAITLARHGWQVTGVDFANRAIRIARKKARQERLQVDLRVDDVTRLDDIQGPFDLILDMGCFHNLSLDGKQNYLNNLERLLAEEGLFLLYVFIREAESGTGVNQAELDHISSRFTLLQRRDGTERKVKPSAWLKFTRNKKPVVQASP